MWTNKETLKHYREQLFEGYENLGSVLFVNSLNQK